MTEDTNDRRSIGKLNPMPKVSVIVNCHNEAEHVGECLESIFAQTFQDWEVIFWDNKSTDASSEIAMSFGEKVRCFRSETMVPLGTARKSAYDQCMGDYIAILDADDIWMPEKLERQLGLFESNPGLGLAFCDTVYFDSTGDRYRLFQLTDPYRGRVFDKILTGNFIFTSSMMYSRAALKQLDCAFDDRYTRVADWDLSLRVAYNFDIDYLVEPLAKWRMFEGGEKPWKKSMVLQPVEAKLALDNLIDANPEIVQKYADELKTFNKNVDYNVGMVSWRDGDISAARRHLSRHLTNKKFAMMYAGTFLIPYGLFNKIRNDYRSRRSGS